jgi:hypothetical protein
LWCIARVQVHQQHARQQVPSDAQGDADDESEGDDEEPISHRTRSDDVYKDPNVWEADRILEERLVVVSISCVHTRVRGWVRVCIYVCVWVGVGVGVGVWVYEHTCMHTGVTYCTYCTNCTYVSRIPHATWPVAT